MTLIQANMPASGTPQIEAEKFPLWIKENFNKRGYNVEDFTTVQEAIDKAYADGGGNVFLPAGTHDFSSIVLKDKVCIYGVGDASILKLVLNAPLASGAIRNTSAGIIQTGMFNLRIDGHASLSSYLLDMYRISNSTFIDVTFRSNGMTGYMVGMDAKNESNYYNMFLHCVLDDSDFTTTAGGFYLARGSNSNNFIANRFIYLNNPVKIMNAESNQNMFVGNQLEWDARAGVAFYVEGSYNQFISNRIESNSASKAFDFTALSVENNEFGNYSTGVGMTFFTDNGTRNGRFGGEYSQTKQLFIKNYIAYATNGTAKLFFENSYNLRTDGNFRIEGNLFIFNQALPAASVTYRGHIIRVEGGAGVADRLVCCIKDATDTYIWKDL